MRLLLLALLVAGCGAWPGSTPTDRPAATATPAVRCSLFVLGGQSNMVGRGRYGELPPGERTLPDQVQIHAVSLDHRLGEMEGLFGPEHSLARALASAYPGQALVFVKYAVDGSSLLDWAPDWDREAAELTGFPEFGPLYQKLIGLVAEVRQGQPGACRPAAVFWMQGERDASIPEAGAQYEQNLIYLIRRFRDDLGVPDLPFILGQVNPPAESYPAVGVVRIAQAQAARLAGRATVVSTAGLSKEPDRVHYDTAGQIELGQRFAWMFLRMLGP